MPKEITNFPIDSLSCAKPTVASSKRVFLLYPTSSPTQKIVDSNPVGHMKENQLLSSSWFLLHFCLYMRKAQIKVVVTNAIYFKSNGFSIHKHSCSTNSHNHCKPQYDRY